MFPYSLAKFCHGVSRIQDFTAIDPIVKSPGIYFNPSGSVKLINDYLHVVIPVEIKYIKPHIENIKNVFHSAQYICAQNNAIDDLECQNSFQPLVSIYEDISRDYYAISHLISSKSKRSAWISGIGTIFKQVFGTMDEDDAIRYGNAIQALKENNNKILDLVKENILISKTAIVNLNESLIEVNKNEKRLSIMIETLSSHARNITVTMNSLLFKSSIQEMFSVLQSCMLSLSYKLEDLINSVLFAKTNTLHPSILTPTELYFDLVNNVKHLPKYVEFPVSLELDNIHKLISLMEIVSYMLDDKLVFTLKIPLIYINKFDLYKNIPVPVPHNVTFSKSYALVIPTSPYVALNQDKSKYITLNDLNNCKVIDHEVYICKQTDEFSTQNYPICETEIITKILISLPKQCKTKFLYGHVDIWQSLGNNKWVFTQSEPTKLSIECNNEMLEHIIMGTGILTLRPNCTGFCKNVKLISKRHPNIKFSHIYSDFNLINDSCCDLTKFKKLNYTETPMRISKLDTNNLNTLNDKTDDLLEVIEKIKAENDLIPQLTPHSLVSYVFVILFVIFIIYYFCNGKCLTFYHKFRPVPLENINNAVEENVELNPHPRIRIN